MHYTHTSYRTPSLTNRFLLWNNRLTRNINKEKENYHYAMSFVFILSSVIYQAYFYGLVVM